MDGSIIGAIAITIAVVIVALVALVARGKMKAVARFFHLELEVDSDSDFGRLRVAIAFADLAESVRASIRRLRAPPGLPPGPAPLDPPVQPPPARARAVAAGPGVRAARRSRRRGRRPVEDGGVRADQRPAGQHLVHPDPGAQRPRQLTPPLHQEAPGAVALALLDRQAHRAGHDEDRDDLGKNAPGLTGAITVETAPRIKAKDDRSEDARV